MNYRNKNESLSQIKLHMYKNILQLVQSVIIIQLQSLFNLKFTIFNLADIVIHETKWLY